MPTDAYSKLLHQLNKISLLETTMSLLGWDEVTYMPRGGGEQRANQLGALAGMHHELATSKLVGDYLHEAESEVGKSIAATAPAAVNLKLIRKDYDRATKLPQRLVEELSHTKSRAQQVWVEARKQNNFALFAPWLEKVINLKREQAQILWDGKGEIYDALLDEYEPAGKSSEIQQVFTQLKQELVPLVSALANSRNQPDESIIERYYPVEKQQEISQFISKAIGFSFNSGRLDISAHPFCTTIGPGDCRLTTRYDERHFNGAFFGTLHESGHGIYEQNLPSEHYGSPLGSAISLGIHESQSRMWENLVGRSLGFWKWYYPQLQKHFAASLGDISLEEFYRAINTSKPSLIRVEADEVTYNLHIMLRFELEREIVAGQLNVADIPGEWNRRFEQYLGITPPNDAQGCMQDVHWSHALIGYFPTYSLGNIYASQFYQAAEQDLGNLQEMFSRGEFKPLREWLTSKIHQHGRLYTAAELVENVTGEKLNPKPMLTHLWQKFGEVYRLKTI